MAFFSSLQQYVDTISARLLKPIRGVSGSEGVTNYDVLDALTDAGKRMQDTIEHVNLTNSDTYIQASIAQAAEQVTLAQQQVAAATTQKDLAMAQVNLANAQRVLTETARAETQAYALQVQALLAQGYTPKGNWTIATNTPNLTTITKAAGDAYIVDADGTTSITGTSIQMKKGDAVHWNAVDSKWIWRPNATIPADGSVSKVKLSSDVQQVLPRKTELNFWESKHIFYVEGIGYVRPLYMLEDGTIVGKFDLSRSTVPRASLSADVLAGLMVPFTSSWWHPYVFYMEDENGKVGWGVKRDRSLEGKIELPDGSIQESKLAPAILAKLPTADFLRLNAYKPTDYDWNEDDELWRGQEVEVPCKTHASGIGFVKLPNVRTNGIRGYNDTGTALEFRRNSGLVIRGEKYQGEYVPAIGAAQLVTSKGWFRDDAASLPASPAVGDYWLCMFQSGNPTTRTVGGVTMSKWDVLYYTAGGWGVQPSPVVAANLRENDFLNVTATGQYWKQAVTNGDRLVFVGQKAGSGWNEPIYAIQKTGEYYLMGECNPASFAPATVRDWDLYVVSADGTYSGLDLKKGDYLYRNTGWGKSEGSLITVAAGNAYALPCRNSNEYSVRRTDKSATQVSVKARANVTLGVRTPSKDKVFYSDSMFGVNIGAAIVALLTGQTSTIQSYGGGTSNNVLSMVKYNIRNGDPYKGRLHTFWHGQNNNTDLTQIKAASLEMARLAGTSQGRCVFWSMLGQMIYSWNGTRLVDANHEDAFNRVNGNRFVELEDWYDLVFPGKHFSPRKAALAASLGRARPSLTHPGMTEGQVAATYGIYALSFHFNYADKPFTAEQLVFQGYRSTAGLPSGGNNFDYYLRTGNGTVGAIIVNVAGAWTEYTYDITHVTAEGATAAFAPEYVNFLTNNYFY